MAPESAHGSGARTLSLLRLIAEGPAEFSLKDLVTRSGLPPSTVHRILQVMVKWEFVERSGSQSYRVGRELFRLASLVLRNYEIQRFARPHLLSLWKDWRETAVFCLFRPSERTGIVVEIIPTPHQLRVVLDPYEEISLAFGSLGRSILAQLPWEEIEPILDTAGVAPVSGKPLPPRPKLKLELETAKRRGFAIHIDRDTDTGGISAPVFGPGHVIMGSMGLLFPASRFNEEDRDAMSDAVLEASRRLTATLSADTSSS